MIFKSPCLLTCFLLKTYGGYLLLTDVKYDTQHQGSSTTVFMVGYRWGVIPSAAAGQLATRDSKVNPTASSTWFTAQWHETDGATE
jgi:hypothetical protein